MSPNVEYLGSIKQDVGMTAGAKVVGDRLSVTSGKNISIYDISNPASPQPGGCVQFFDVRDPANIKQVGTIPIPDHTAECALDCRYFYGKAGTIIDARGILDGTPPKVVGNWHDELAEQGVNEQSCHHIREIRPGILLTACRPFAVISILARDGGSPEHPQVLYKGEAAKFVHSARWPRSGKD